MRKCEIENLLVMDANYIQYLWPSCLTMPHAHAKVLALLKEKENHPKKSLRSVLHQAIHIPSYELLPFCCRAKLYFKQFFTKIIVSRAKTYTVYLAKKYYGLLIHFLDF